MPKRKAADAASLCSLGRRSYVSKRGISALADAFTADGVPAAHSRASQYRARKAICETETPYGRLVQPLELICTDGRTTEVAVQSPLAMLYHTAGESKTFADLLRATVVAHPPVSSKPWHLIVYQDGVDPSDGLSVNHSRKSNVFYWSFLEFGMAALSNENNWLPISIGRYNLLTHVEGGVTQLASKVAMLFFEPHDLELVGVRIKLHGDDDSIVLWGKIGCILADEPAIKEILSCKGHAGQKPCVLCMNCTAHAPSGADGLHKHHRYPASISNTDFRAFTLHSDKTLRLAVQKLHSMKGCANFDDMEQVYGFSYNPWNLLLNHRLQLNAASTLMYDWAHCFVCDGVPIPTHYHNHHRVGEWNYNGLVKSIVVKCVI